MEGGRGWREGGRVAVTNMLRLLSERVQSHDLSREMYSYYS